MKWIGTGAETSRLEAAWTALRETRNRWAIGLRRHPHHHQRLRPPLASAAEMRRAKWKMNYERDADGRLR